jgi:hypothetical protein
MVNYTRSVVSWINTARAVRMQTFAVVKKLILAARGEPKISAVCVLNVYPDQLLC